MPLIFRYREPNFIFELINELREFLFLSIARRPISVSHNPGNVDFSDEVRENLKPIRIAEEFAAHQIDIVDEIVSEECRNFLRRLNAHHYF